MMTRALRDGFNNLLRRGNYRIAYSPRAEICGFRFSEDIRVLIPGEAPVCLDIGANQGQTIAMLSEIFPRPRIYAFEPASVTFKRLQAAPRGPNVSLHQLAMGAEDGAITFHNYEDSCLSSIHALDLNAGNRFRNVKLASTETVPVRSVDSFVKEQGIQTIDLLKIDTQGHDLEVLRGAAGCFRRGLVRNVFIELNFIKLYQHQGDVRQIMDCFASHGLQLVEFYEKVRGKDGVLQWCTALYTRSAVA